MFAPVMGLLFIVIFKAVGMAFLAKYADKAITVPVPGLFGIDYKGLSVIANNYINVSTCNQWYMYEFDNSINEADK